MKLKDKLEYHAVLNFIVEYNRTHKRKLHFTRQCKPRMPDVLCRLNKKEIGIEVAHTYGTGEEAAMLLGNRDMKDFSDKVHRARRLTPLDVRALGSLNEILAKKATRTYDFLPTWLLVRNAFVLWSLKDYRKHQEEILIPDGHPFEQIWFFVDAPSVGPKGIMRLY